MNNGNIDRQRAYLFVFFGIFSIGRFIFKRPIEEVEARQKNNKTLILDIYCIIIVISLLFFRFFFGIGNCLFLRIKISHRNRKKQHGFIPQSNCARLTKKTGPSIATMTYWE